MKKTKISLQPSEGLVFQAAATIYAAYLTAGRVAEGKEEEWMQRALRDSVHLALATDQSLQSDTELD
ncbi:MAG: hypothetical protein AB1813_05980 [Verrucomicrobiota bacterium]|jgi:hypothetical protein